MTTELQGGLQPEDSHLEGSARSRKNTCTNEIWVSLFVSLVICRVPVDECGGQDIELEMQSCTVHSTWYTSRAQRGDNFNA